MRTSKEKQIEECKANIKALEENLQSVREKLASPDIDYYEIGRLKLGGSNLLKEIKKEKTKLEKLCTK